jgi:hypothetical protein
MVAILMPKMYPVKNSLNSGELSPLISGIREDISKYGSGCVILENSVPLVEGSAKKMPGSYFAGPTANGGSMFLGSISGNILDVTKIYYGYVNQGATLIGDGITPNTVIGRALECEFTGSISTGTANQDTVSTSGVGNVNGTWWEYNSNEWRTTSYAGTQPSIPISAFTVRGFGLNIPTTATILGVTISFLGASQSTNTGTVSQVALWNSSGQIGVIKPESNLIPPPGPGNAYTAFTYGGSTDLWEASLTPTILNDPTFGFAVGFNLDAVRIFLAAPFLVRVDYTIPSGAVLTVYSVQFGTLAIGQTISGQGISSDTEITAFGTGAGGIGTYSLNSSQPVASEQMYVYETSSGGIGYYLVNNPQTIPSEIMQTASSGKSRLAPFQFSTDQGAILEFSAGVVRIWEGASEGSWPIGLALEAPPESGYNPATVYAADQVVTVGPTFVAGAYPTAAGQLFISAPYGTTNAATVPIQILTNIADTLSVTVTNTSPVQGIQINLAATTPGKNATSLIQAAIQALGSLNTQGYNYVDLSEWTVTSDQTYYGNPWTSLPAGFTSGWVNDNWIAESIQANSYFQFPIAFSLNPIIASGYNAYYWEAFDASSEMPIELTTPYLEADLFDLDCSTQSADVLWVFHPNYPPACIERLSANSWQYSTSLPGQTANEPTYRGTADIVKTGYSALGQNISLISQSNPAIVVLASNTTTAPFVNGGRIYINECSGLVELNEGEFLVSGIAYGSVTITVIDSSGTSSSITVNDTWYMNLLDPDTNAEISTASGLQYQGGGFAVAVIPMFAASGDYPSCGCLYQERLNVGGSNNNPTQLNGSVEDDYSDFISDPNEDDYAYQFTLVSNQVNQLLNMVGTPNALIAGTSGGIWVINSSTGTSISQSNVNASLQSTYGVSQLQPQVVNGSAIFASRSSRIVTFVSYNFVTNQWENIDLTRLNREITIGSSASTSGIAQTSFQMEPYPIFWAVRNDGQLIGLVFNTQDQVFGWFRINMLPEGGMIESCAVISGQNQEDQLVVVVNRQVNGVTQRYVEYFMPQELFHQLSNAFFVHCGQQWQGAGPFNITSIQNTSPCLFYANGILPSGSQVQITGVEGMTEINQSPNQAYTVQPGSGGGYLLYDSSGVNPIDATGWGVYSGGGTVSQVQNYVTGMSYLLGNQVTAVGDGAVILQPTEVTSDQVNFPYYANLITIGLPYTTTIQPTNPVLSQQSATTRGMRQKLNRVTISLYESMGGQMGTDFSYLYPIEYGTGTMAQPPSMFSGEVTRDVDADWEEQDKFIVQQSDPLPFTLRGVVFRLTANQD